MDKTCALCGETFSASRKDKKVCSKPCGTKLWRSLNLEHDRQRQRDRYRETSEKRKAYQREYAKTPAGRETSRASDRRRRFARSERLPAILKAIEECPSHKREELAHEILEVFPQAGWASEAVEEFLVQTLETA